MRRGALAGAAALAGIALACSSLAPEPTPVECQSDDDCNTAAGEVCALDQGKVCYEATLPARALLGLDVRDNPIGQGASPFRVEVRGTDASVERITTRSPSRYRVSVANRGQDPLFPGVRDTIGLHLREVKHFESKGAGEVVSAPFAAYVVLTQTSRLGQTPSTVGDNSTLRFPVLDPQSMTPLEDAPLVIPWPHYTAGDVDGGKNLLAELRAPSDAPDPRGPVHRLIRRDQLAEATSHDITVDVTDACFRRLAGTASILAQNADPPENLDVAGVTISLRYAESLPSPATVQPPPAPIGCSSDLNCPTPSVCVKPDAGARACGCEIDAHCPSGQVCNPDQKRCTLDLRDLAASRQITVDLAAGQGPFSDLWVYSHCEGAVEENREIALVVNAEPPIESGLPRLSYRVVQNFPIPVEGGDPTPLPLGGKICLPHWRPAQAIQVPLRGAPAKLVDDPAQVCCDAACLNDTTPAPKPSSCTPTATVASSGTFTLPAPPTPDDASPWESAGCLPLYVAGQEDPTSIRFTRQATSCTGDGCELRLSPGGFDAIDPAAYDLRIEPPVGSVFRSLVVPVQVAVDTVAIPEIVLAPRIVLRGRVSLDPAICDPLGDTAGDDDACSAKAVVMAERLRLPEEDGQTVLGPYFYALPTFGAGDFVLPVNPGVYLLTALPAIGSQGGPAVIKVVDLREDGPRVEVRGGVPYADLAEPLVLQRGELVTFELDGFSLNTQAIPLDLASWASLTFEGAPVDLNATPTCYRASGDPPACQIRRLRPGNTALRPSQEGFVKYVTR